MFIVLRLVINFQIDAVAQNQKKCCPRVIPFIVLWFIFTLIYCLLEKGILGNLDYYPSTGNQYKFVANILVIPATGVLIGLLTGILEIGYFSKWFIKKSFTRKILIKSLIYLAIIIIFLFLTLLMNALYMHREHSFENMLSPVREFFTTSAIIGLVIYMAACNCNDTILC